MLQCRSSKEEDAALSNSALKQEATRGGFLKLSKNQFYLSIVDSFLHRAHYTQVHSLYHQ